MSDDEADDMLLIGAGLAGLAGLGFLAWRGFEKRRTFQERLAQELASLHVGLVFPDLGFLADGRHAWNLTVEVPGWGVETLFAPLEKGSDPYADSTVQDLARRVGAWLHSRAA